MKTFKASRPCAKCGHADCYEAGSKEYATARFVATWTGKEVVKRMCKRCGYTWNEYPLDATSTVTATGDVEPQPEETVRCKRSDCGAYSRGVCKDSETDCRFKTGGRNERS